jgi:hypothetical protein
MMGGSFIARPFAEGSIFPTFFWGWGQRSNTDLGTLRTLFLRNVERISRWNATDLSA